MTPLVPPDNIVTQMRSALAAARKAGASPEQMDFLVKAWGREIENFNEAEQLGVAQEGTYGQQALGGIASIAKDIPGAEALQAGARSVVRGQPYGEALGDIRGAEATASPLARIPNRVIGGGLAAASLPIKSPAMAGAAYGGLLNLLGADEQSTGERAANTAVGATVGGVTGKLTDMAVTGARGVLAEPIGKAMTRLKGERAAASGPLYQQAIAQGAGQTGTPEVAAWLARPEVQDIVGELSKLDEFAGLAPDDPRMLDAIYKSLSDQTGTIVRRMNTAAPRDPNVGRAAERQLRTVREQGVSAMSDPLHAPMPAYRPAVDAYAEGSRRLEGLTRGNNAMAIETGAGVSPERLERFGRDNLLDWLRSQSPEVVDATVQGMTGFGGRKLEQGGVTGLLNPMRGMGRNFLTKGGDLLRAVEGTAAENASAPLTRMTLLDYLQRSGTAGVTPNSPFP